MSNDQNKTFMGVTMRARLKNYIAKNPGATLPEAAAGLGVSQRRLREAIVDLLNFGHVKPDPKWAHQFNRRNPENGHFYPRRFVVDDPNKNPDEKDSKNDNNNERGNK